MQVKPRQEAPGSGGGGSQQAQSKAGTKCSSTVPPAGAGTNHCCCTPSLATALILPAHTTAAAPHPPALHNSRLKSQLGSGAWLAPSRNGTKAKQSLRSSKARLRTQAKPHCSQEGPPAKCGRGWELGAPPVSRGVLQSVEPGGLHKQWCIRVQEHAAAAPATPQLPACPTLPPPRCSPSHMAPLSPGNSPASRCCCACAAAMMAPCCSSGSSSAGKQSGSVSASGAGSTSAA